MQARVLDLSPLAETEGRALEGTGSIVFDHLARKAFACRSNRTDEDLLGRVCKEIGGYEPVVFTSRDKNGQVRKGEENSFFCHHWCSALLPAPSHMVPFGGEGPENRFFSCDTAVGFLVLIL